MIMKKPISHFPLVNKEGFQGKKSVVNGGKSQSQRKSIESNHWRFLEEIDAPMWVDLTVESKSYQDIDDAWFKTSHPFHQCSSRQLISAFNDLGEEIPNSNDDSLGPSSPKLPPSVSQSRGKHYRSKKWKDGDQAKSVAKQHPIKVLGRKTLPVVSHSLQEVKPKISFANSKRTSNLKARSESNSLLTKPSSRSTKCSSSLKTNSVSESGSTETKQSNLTRTKTSIGNSEHTSSLNASSVCDSNSASMESPNSSNPISSSGDLKSSSNSSTVISSFIDSKSSSNTSIGIVVQGSQSVSEEPNQIFGRPSGFLSAVKISLRRSFVTRQASRVEIKGGQQEHNSSSGKSSVGSSNSGFNLKTVNRTLNSRKDLTMAQSKINNKRTGTNVSKSSSGQDHNTTSRQERIALASKSISHEISKSKGLHQAEPRKSSRVHNVQDELLVGLKAKKVVVDSKVNHIGSVGSKPLVGGKDDTLESKDQRQKASKCSSEVKNGQGLFDVKQGKANGRNKGKNQKNVVQKKVYFR